MNRALISLTTLALALPAVAQAPAREAPPAPGTPRAFNLPVPQRFTLENGLKVTLVPYGSLPKVAVELSVLVGNANEKAGETWLADLTGRLMREGTKTRSSTQISLEAARMGGSLDVTAGEDRTEIGGEVLSEFAGDMVRLLADVAQNPVFPESELARLESDLLRQLSLARSQPQPLARERFRQALYGDHPYGRLFPTPEQLQG
jgi:predicted Zn-dependent peptidase